MSATEGSAQFIELATDIVSAYVSNNSVSTEELPSLIKDVFGARYQKLYGDTKYKEALAYLRTVSDFDYRTYLPRI